MITYKKPHKSGCPVHLDTFMRGTFNTNGRAEERHCSYCVHYWTGNGQMYCTLRKHRITSARKNGCKLFEHYGNKNTKYLA